MGRLGIEIEVELLDWLTVETVPVFVTNNEPFALSLTSSRGDVLSQHSEGLGALSGASIGLGFWLDGTPFKGTVLRATLTNYTYRYESRPGDVLVDSLTHTERHFVALYGGYRKWGHFSIGGGLGVGIEMNDDERCFDDVGQVKTTDCDGGLDLKVNDTPTGIAPSNPRDMAHPIYFAGRISLGVVF